MWFYAERCVQYRGGNLTGPPRSTWSFYQRTGTGVRCRRVKYQCIPRPHRLSSMASHREKISTHLQMEDDHNAYYELYCMYTLAVEES